jgi:O-antigen/teichoic acid export membrane protein
VSSLGKDSTITFITRIIVLGMALVISAVTARQLGPTLQGAYQIIILILNTTVMFFLLGLASANIFVGARQPELLPTMAGNSLAAAVALGVTAVILLEGLLLLPSTRQYLAENSVPLGLLRTAVWILPALLLSNFMVEIIRATGQIRLYNALALFQMGLYLSLLLLLLSVSADKLHSVVTAWALSYASLAVLTTGLALKAVGFQVQLSWPVFRRSLVFGLKNHAAQIAQFLNYRLDLFLVGLFLPPASVAFYGIATMYAERIWEIPGSIRASLMYHAAADQASAAMMTARSARVVLFVVGVFCLLLMVIAYPFILIVYGEAYLPVVPALILLMPGVWIFSMGKLLAVYIASENRPEIGTYIALVALVVTVIFDLVLIPTLGITGAAIASSLSYSVSSLLLLVMFLRMSKLTWRQTMIIQRADWVYIRRMFSRARQHLALRLPVRS